MISLETEGFFLGSCRIFTVAERFLDVWEFSWGAEGFFKVFESLLGAENFGALKQFL